MGVNLEQYSQQRCCPDPVHGGDSVTQKQDLGQLNIMPRHTFLRTALTRERINSPASEMAFDHMLQGAVKEVSVHPLHVSELVWLSS